ncbi:iron-sulfur cluster assembly scaffold protein [Pelagibius sp. Alg239-R121]|uniref:iron-sulfur cluster assembly scaffold protein n=1 Tax=Pelagibius sp. Alg239-R121 TaxID=2993448 RepID=UPI0024A78A3D|nr:iron-sulfur cluster assembly scaffold protein [Pelagibius sp. Alg239-R121]
MTDLDLYNKQILGLAASIPRVGRLAAPDASAFAQSRLCGSRIIIDLKLDGRVITDYAHELRACVIGQAVASVIAKVIVGLTIDEVERGAGILSALLRDKTPPPPGSWAKLEPFLPVADIRSRHGSALLPFQALLSAIAGAYPGSPWQRGGLDPAPRAKAQQTGATFR